MIKLLFLLIFPLVILGGCTKITILDKEKTVSIHRSFGSIKINASPTTDVIIGEVTSFGYMASPIGVSIGYGNHSFAFLPERCHVVVWIDDNRNLSEINELIKNTPTICLIESKLK